MSFIKKSIGLFGIVAYYLTASGIIEACSSCDTMAKFSQAKIDAYYATIYLLGGTPLFLGALLVFIVYRSSKKKSTEE